MRSCAALAIASTLAVVGPPALALDQPNGVTVPTEPGCDGGRPTGLAATFACVCVEPGVCNIGEVCPSETSCDDGRRSTCESTMWHSWNDNTCIPSNLAGLDPRAEASTTPMTFSPVCPLTFTVIGRGTAMFRDAFGWYNVTGSRPSADDLHVMLGCDAAAGDSAVLDIHHHPDYAGGEIGFFLVTPESAGGSTCAGGDCCATVARAAAGQGHVYYSERQHNPDFAGSASYIHLLVYDSHVWEHTFYFAWEDIFGGSNNDFTDLVTAVSGVECAGGGAACETGSEGICAYGVTGCLGESLVCRTLYEPETERCDGLDNDCDGRTDEDVVCPERDHVCHNGQCVPHCRLTDEFTCAWGFVCDAETGFCVEEACIGIDCREGEVCQRGHCVGGCEDVVCPHGRSCRLGRCVDPCAGVSCPAPDVCREGVCVPGCGECNGIVCSAPLVCDETSRDCFDPSCASPCPEGSHCSAGGCVDDCEGAVCPGGQRCVGGDCVYPDEPGDDGGPGRDGGPDPDGGPDDGGPDAGEVSVTPSCRCEVAGARGAGPAALALLALVGLGRAIRRR